MGTQYVYKYTRVRTIIRYIVKMGTQYVYKYTRVLLNLTLPLVLYYWQVKYITAFSVLYYLQVKYITAFSVLYYLQVKYITAFSVTDTTHVFSPSDYKPICVLNKPISPSYHRYWVLPELWLSRRRHGWQCVVWWRTLQPPRPHTMPPGTDQRKGECYI